MASLQIYCLGPPRVLLNQTPVELGRRTTLALLVYLAVTNHPQSRAAIATLLWPDTGQSQAHKALRRDLALLTKAIGKQWFVIERDTIGLSLDTPPWVDVHHFQQSVEVSAADGQAASQKAVALYQDDFLSGFTLPASPPFDEWQFFQTEHYRQTYARALDTLVQHHTELADYPAALDYALRRLALDPLHEPAQRTLMQLYAWAGQPTAALRQYDECVRLLAAELDAAPEAETVQLYGLIKARRLALPHKPQPVLPASLQHNLPASLTALIGREAEIAKVTHSLHTATARLVTLVGPGGVGKTRLALTIGATLADPLAHAPETPLPPPFRDGVWLVELAPITELTLVAESVATVLGLVLTNRPAQVVLLDFLRERSLLLILDNCEHLIDACATLSEVLLRACPTLHILATSREALNIPGEITWPVPSLAPAAATQLFVERAQAAKPDFSLTHHNAQSVAQICTQLDHIPLALELAAARLRTFSVEQIATRLHDAFRLLTSGSRTALPRQQTLRASIDWSYGLLSDEERTLLRRLSVCAGGWRLEAAEALGEGDVLELLDQLVSKSLVQMDERMGEPRYRMLELVRQYAHEKLSAAGEQESMQERHLAFFVKLVDAAQAQLHGPQELAWLDRLEIEIDNLRMALDRAAQTSNVLGGAQLVHGLWWFWFVRGDIQEGQRWVVMVLPDERTEQSPAARAIAHHAAGWLLVRQGYHREGFQHFLVALPAAQQTTDDRLVADVTRALGNSSNGEQSIQLLNEALRLYSVHLAHYDMAITLMLLGMHLRAERRAQEAAARFQTALDLLRPLQERWGMAQILYRLGLLAMDSGDDGQANTWLEQSTQLLRELRDPIGSADNLCILTMLALRRRDAVGALAALKEAIVLFNNVGHLDRIGQCLELGASYIHAHGDLTRATVLLGAADGAWRQSGQHFRPDPDADAEFYRILPLVRAELDAADFEAAWAAGQQMTAQQMVVTVLALE